MSELPKEWIQTSLQEVVQLNPKSNLDDELIVGFSPMAMIPTDFRGVVAFEEKSWIKVKKGYTHFQNGDVLFAKVTPCFENGKSAHVTNLPNGQGAGSTEYFVLRPFSHSLHPKYLLALVKTRDFLRDGATNMTGSVGLKRIPKKFVQNYPLALAPLAEQREIADRLDTLLAQVDTLKGRLDDLPGILKRFRQSVLAAAVSGKLTEEWRGLAEYSEDGYPSNWEKKGFSDIGELARGKSKHRPRNDPRLFGGDYPFVQTGEIANSNGRISSANKFYSEFGLSQSRLFPAGTLCITIAANIADTSILNIDACFPDSIVGFTPDSEICDAQFIKYLVDTNKENLERFAPATAQKNINLKVLNKLRLPIPLHEEQTEIVRRVEQLFAFADQVEQRVKEAQGRVNNLTQSILAKAFRGELTAEWREQHPELISGENSASALLARIQAERAAQAPVKRTRKKKVSA